MNSLRLTKTLKTAQYCVIETPFGCLGVETQEVDGSLMLSKIDYLPPKTLLVAPQNALAWEFARQSTLYWQNPSYIFDLPLKPLGSIHQQKVWRSTEAIPVGSTKTYGEIARSIGSGARAVGAACGANPYPLLTPCHRVVSAQGIGGFMQEDSPGLFRQIKIWLLKHEGAL